MTLRRRVLFAVWALLAVGLVACTSPEVERTRGGGPGADIGNRGPVVEMHEGAQPYYRTPCVTTLDTCTGPLPVFGRPSADRA
jgi:hypothetical protein